MVWIIWFYGDFRVTWSRTPGRMHALFQYDISGFTVRITVITIINLRTLSIYTECQAGEEPILRF